MKTKTLKKLSFNKLTLVNLDNHGMRNLRGGLSPTVTSCPEPCQTLTLCTVPCITAIPYYCDNSNQCTVPCEL